ncbi:MAG TPA: SrtB family sortase [Firmicutes bacterium]|nr:SrtB family sortase [Bacillota bacterium]
MKLRKKWQDVIFLSFVVLFGGILIYAVVNIGEWFVNSKDTLEEIEKIQENVLIEEQDNTETEIIEPQEEILEDNPYWDYVKMNLINVDFTELKDVNTDVVGWIEVKGTNINYPFVQGKDNEYYLSHSFNKSYNKAGWVFLDYRNQGTDNKNTIIYAHGRNDKTMFGSLKNIFSNGWLKNKDNYVVRISTETENSLWQVFSVYKIPTTSDYLQVDFINDDEFWKFGKRLKDRSAFDFGTVVEKTDRILTLSTCYNNSEKVVLHAKLIKRSTK